MAATHRWVIYNRYGSFEPGCGFWGTGSPELGTGTPEALGNALKLFLTNECTVSRWELQTVAGVTFDSGELNLAGTLLADFDDFRDCTWLSFRSSGGSEKPSGVYVPGRNNALWSKGVPQASLTVAKIALVAAMTSNGIADSDGAAVLNIATTKPSRRNRMRLAA